MHRTYSFIYPHRSSTNCQAERLIKTYSHVSCSLYCDPRGLEWLVTWGHSTWGNMRAYFMFPQALCPHVCSDTVPSCSLRHCPLVFSHALYPYVPSDKVPAWSFRHCPLVFSHALYPYVPSDKVPAWSFRHSLYPQVPKTLYPQAQ